jgi:nucleoside-diphosphate-sugar epimerase
MSLILVTGGTGFIGRYVLRRLARERGDVRVRALVRDPRRIDPSIRESVEIVQGDLLDRAALRSSVAGADTVLHLAALARAWAPDAGAFHAVNAGAVAALLEEAARAGVQRFVHVSSVVAGVPFAPGAGSNGHRGATPYEESKRESERLVFQNEASGLHAVIVRPTRVYGPGPMNDANGVAVMLSLYLQGRFRVIPDDGDVLANYVHADDVAQGILLAARFGRSGAVYELGGENMSLRGLLGLASEIAGVRRRVVRIPPWTGLAAAAVVELAGKFGVTPFITRAWLHTFLEDRRVDIGPARRDLGYAPRSLQDGLAETIAWLRGPAAGNES